MNKAHLEKDPEVFVHQQEPLNVGVPAALVRQTFITPNSLFFVRNHGSIPRVKPDQYRLSISGMVHVNATYSLNELKTLFPSQTVTATLQCAGHRRHELAAVAPIVGEIPWAEEAIGTAVWRGVLLRDVLLSVGVKEQVRHVAFTGCDEVQREGRVFGFGGSIPIEVARSAAVLLAYEMNGEPLSPEHGAPLRVVVPGYIGARSVKWLANIHLQEEPSTNYFQRCAYRLFPPHIRHESASKAEGTMLGPLPLNSVICFPQPRAILSTGFIRVQGYAISGAGQHVERVELSPDGGSTWIRTTLQRSADDSAWTFWEAVLELSPGTHQLVSRAWNSAGSTQPEHLAQVWNWKGYANNAWHRIEVTVLEGEEL